MMRKLILVFVFITYFIFSVSGQRTERMKPNKLSFERAVLLFSHNNFSNAQKEFTDIQNAQGFNLNQKLEAEYYSSLCALYLNQPSEQSVDKLVDFAQKNPNHPKAKHALFNIASDYYSKKKFKESAQYYNQVTLSEFENDQRDKGRFELAYSYFELKEYDLAETNFDRVKNQKTSYSPAANYYSGYIKLKKGKYDLALSDFKTAEKTESYKKAVPVMITNIYHKQKKFDELIAYAEPIAKSKKSVTNKKEIIGLVAEAYYGKQNYKKAQSFYESFVGNKKARIVSTNFKYGNSAYKNSDFKTATSQFKLIAGTKDSISQVASYYLGNSYLKEDNNKFALNSYLEASNSTWDKNITSLSLYNAGKIQYSEKQYTSAIKTFNSLTEKYPNFKDKSEVSNLITESYLNSNNLGEALKYIESLPSPRSSRINTVYQKVTHNEGIKLYNSKKYKESISYFKKSQAHNYDSKTQLESFFWTAEAYSKLSDWKNASKYYIKTSVNKKSNFYLKSLYGLGYCYFNQSDYNNAKSYFNNYINSGIVNSKSPYYASALVRIGDCELQDEKWIKARARYKEVIELNTTQVSYALYATGLTYFYDNKDSEAISYFEQVIKKHPKSYHFSKALFQYGYVNHINDKHDKAIKGFSRLIKEKPQNNILAETYLFRGRSYHLSNQSDKALEDFDHIIKHYCHLSLDGKQSIALEAKSELAKLVEQEKISAAQFDIRLNKIVECVPGLDVEYEKFSIAKGKRYNEKNYLGAIKDIETFLTKYPKSKYLIEAKFILGECFFLTNDLNKAKENFNYVLNNAPDTDYLTTVNYLANIANTENDKPSIIKYNKILVKNLDNPEQILKSYLALMTTSFETEKYKEALSYSKEVLEREANIPHSQSEAKLYKGKSEYYLNDTINATKTLTEKAQTSQDQYGAEAMFYLAKIKQDQQKYVASNDTLDVLCKKFKSESYWVNKSWFLIAENYEELGEQLQAISKYKLLVKYSPFEKIKEDAKSKLLKIEQDKAREDSLLVKPDTLEIGE